MAGQPHLFIATLVQETNTFVPVPTGIADFENKVFATGGVEQLPELSVTGPARIWRRLALDKGWRVSEGLHAYAEPGGTATRQCYETLRELILEPLRRAGTVDVVLLKLHGAMVADGYDDCEGDILKRVRDIVGADAIVGAALDLHAHFSDAMVENADNLVFFKAYPHTDYNERARESYDLAMRQFAGEIRPVMATYDCPVLGIFPTTRSAAMKDLVARMTAQEGRDGVLSLSLSHGFPWADLPLTGGRMLAITDNDPAKAEEMAREFGQAFMRIKEEAALEFVPLDAALDMVARATEFPVLVADTSDQTGGGAPGDSTFMLQGMIERGIVDACFAPIWDPVAVRYCFNVGEGARVQLRVGGKATNLSGAPLDLDVVVKRLKRNASQLSPNGEAKPVGDAVLIEAAGIEIILTMERNSISSTSFYEMMGIDLSAKKVIGVKSLYRYYDVFEPLCAQMIMAGGPGACSPDWDRLPYRRLSHPIWPLDDMPSSES